MGACVGGILAAHFATQADTRWNREGYAKAYAQAKAALETAKIGHYGLAEVTRGLSQTLLARHFHHRGNGVGKRG